MNEKEIRQLKRADKIEKDLVKIISVSQSVQLLSRVRLFVIP